MGMAKIWAASATLTHVPTNSTIDNFPVVRWENGQQGNKDSTSASVHQEWTIPASIPLGNYSLAVSGK